jgi:protein CpxP
MNKMMFRKPMIQVATLALCTTLLSSVPMLAQDNLAPAPSQADQSAPPADQSAPPMGGRGDRGGHQLERLTKKLNLSPDQVAQVQTIDQDTRTQSMAVRNDSSLAPADRRGKMMDIRKTSQDKIRAVLNDDQKAKYDAMLAQMQERRMNHQGGQGQDAPPPPPPADAPQQ